LRARELVADGPRGNRSDIGSIAEDLFHPLIGGEGLALLNTEVCEQAEAFVRSDLISSSHSVVTFSLAASTNAPISVE
jgi:hypothetical protein